MTAAGSQQHTDSFFDAYSILGVPEDANEALINTEYRISVLKCHPDRFPEEEKATKTVEFKKIQLAYETLSQQDLRAKHDHDRRLAHSIIGKDDAKFSYAMRGRASGAETHRGGIVTARDDDPSRRQGGYSRQPPEREGWRNQQRGPGMLATAGLIQNHRVHAMPDTGAGLNLISSSLATALGYSRPPEHAMKGVELRMANGKHLKTIGVIEASWSFFPEAKETWKLMFHIVEDFFYDTVLGNDFLMFTQTMSKHQHRLSRVPVPMKSLSVLFVNTLGRVNQRIKGFINDVMVDALPDSGSESNLISFDYCQAKGWDNNLQTGDTRLLLFPDGSVQQTLGTIRLKWDYESSQNGWGIMLEFHVLFGCVYDAILGQEMLEETSAFELHQKSFLKVEAKESGHLEQSDLNLVIWLPFRRAKKKASDAGSVGDEVVLLGSAGTSVNSELKRRAAAESAIRRLPHGWERETAMAEETEIRRRYDEGQGRHHRVTPSSGVSSLREPEPVKSQGMNLDSQLKHDGLTQGASIAPWSPSWTSTISADKEITTSPLNPSHSKRCVIVPEVAATELRATQLVEEMKEFLATFVGETSRQEGSG